jgi:hypothetical protein
LGGLKTISLASFTIAIGEIVKGLADATRKEIRDHES